MRRAVDDTRRKISGLAPPPLPRPNRYRWVWAAAGTVLIGVGLVVWPGPRTVMTFFDPIESIPVVLADDHLWPETPADMSPVELAESFARQTLGWDSAGGTEIVESVTGGGAWVRVQQAGVEELVDVLTIPASDGRVVVLVGPPWERGVHVSAIDSGGTRVFLLRIAGSAWAEVTVRLEDGTQIVETTPVNLGDSSSVRVDLVRVDPQTVRSVLVRYFDADRQVIAANGEADLQLDMSTPSTAFAERADAAVLDDVPDSCPVTVPEDNAFSPESQTPAAPPDVYDIIWFGTPQLWTMLDADGAVWGDLPTQADGTLTERTFWWSENYSPDDPGRITVEAERVDQSAPKVVTTEQAGSGFNPFMLQPTHESVTVIGIDLPGPGCWELSAEYKGATLSYVAWVSNN